MTELPLQYASAEPVASWRTMDLLKKVAPLVGLALVFAFFAALRPGKFPTAGNMQLMLLQTVVVLTAALGMTLIIITGGIDLSVGSNIALCTVVVGVLLMRGWPPPVAALGGIMCGMLCGLLNGGLITLFGLTPFIVTLGGWGALRGIAKGLADERSVNPDPTWLNQLILEPTGKSAWMIFPPGVWITLILSLLVAGLLRYTRFGRHVFAIGSNEQTARLCGVNVGLTKVAVYTIAGGLTGVAGVLQFAYLNSGDPTTANGMELNVIAAVVIGGASLTGGQGTILGTIIGALLMTVVANGCTKLGIRNWTQEIVTGAIIVLAAGLDRVWNRKGT